MRRLAWLLVLGSLTATMGGCDKVRSMFEKDKKSKASKDDDESDEDDGDKKKKKKKKKGDDTEPKATASAVATTGVVFAGIYRSTYGDVRVRQAGDIVTGTYPGSTMNCVAKDRELDCDWRNDGNSGKARLRKTAAGDLDGSWGTQQSYDNGGRWLFTLLTSGDPGPTGDEVAVGSFAGDYVSTFGVVSLTEQGKSVKGTYPGGVVDCVADGANLDCSWKESSYFGKAKLSRRLNGDISGTWGNRASATDGGTWLFRKK